VSTGAHPGLVAAKMMRGRKNTAQIASRVAPERGAASAPPPRHAQKAADQQVHVKVSFRVPFKYDDMSPVMFASIQMAFKGAMLDQLSGFGADRVEVFLHPGQARKTVAHTLVKLDTLDEADRVLEMLDDTKKLTDRTILKVRVALEIMKANLQIVMISRPKLEVAKTPIQSVRFTEVNEATEEHDEPAGGFSAIWEGHSDSDSSRVADVLRVNAIRKKKGVAATTSGTMSHGWRQNLPMARENPPVARESLPVAREGVHKARENLHVAQKHRASLEITRGPQKNHTSIALTSTKSCGSPASKNQEFEWPEVVVASSSEDTRGDLLISPLEETDWTEAIAASSSVDTRGELLISPLEECFADNELEDSAKLHASLNTVAWLRELRSTGRELFNELGSNAHDSDTDGACSEPLDEAIEQIENVHEQLAEVDAPRDALWQRWIKVRNQGLSSPVRRRSFDSFNVSDSGEEERDVRERTRSPSLCSQDENDAPLQDGPGAYQMLVNTRMRGEHDVLFVAGKSVLIEEVLQLPRQLIGFVRKPRGWVTLVDVRTGTRIAERIGFSQWAMHEAALRIQALVRGRNARKQHAKDLPALEAAKFDRLFRKLLGTVVRIQSWYRGRHVRMLKDTIIWVLKVEPSALVIQRRIRGYLGKCTVHRLKHEKRRAQAVTRIQAHQRGVSVRGVQSRKKRAVNRIQTASRSRLQRKKVVRDRAATKIQAWFRGCVERTQLSGEQAAMASLLFALEEAEMEAREKKKQAAAATIQAHIRGRADRTELNRRHKAATKIQSISRGNWIRNRDKRVEISKKNDAAARIQAVHRGQIGRKIAKDKKHEQTRHLAATTIQAFIRGENGRALACTKRHLETCNVVLVNKLKTRMKRVVALMRKRRAYRSALKIQARFRGDKERHVMRTKTANATKIQASYRGQVSRRRGSVYQARELKAWNDKKVREHGAATKIQARYRTHSAQSKLPGLKIEKRRDAAARPIQQFYRIRRWNIIVKWLDATALNNADAVQKIQNLMRQIIARRIVREKRRLKRYPSAVLAVQRNWRGYVARHYKCAPLRKYRRDFVETPAVLKIQKWYREKYRKILRERAQEFADAGLLVWLRELQATSAQLLEDIELKEEFQTALDSAVQELGSLGRHLSAEKGGDLWRRWQKQHGMPASANVDRGSKKISPRQMPSTKTFPSSASSGQNGRRTMYLTDGWLDRRGKSSFYKGAEGQWIGIPGRAMKRA